MPAENEPAEPNALTQSLQLTCSLMPSSTVPSTRLVIIWLKRCLARSLTELPLESAPVVVGVEVGVDEDVEVEVELELDVDVEVEHPVPSELSLYSVLMCVEVYVPQEVDCAWAIPDSSRRKNSDTATSMVPKTIQPREGFAIVSARTACRWDRCRHLRREPPGVSRPHVAWCCRGRRQHRRSWRRSTANYSFS